MSRLKDQTDGYDEHRKCDICLNKLRMKQDLVFNPLKSAPHTLIYTQTHTRT